VHLLDRGRHLQAVHTDLDIQVESHVLQDNLVACAPVEDTFQAAAGIQKAVDIQKVHQAAGSHKVGRQKALHLDGASAEVLPEPL